MSKNIALLKKRIEENYEDFKLLILDLDKEDIFSLSKHIAVREDVHFHMSTHDWVDEDEAAYLLGFTEPLTMLADAWECYLENQCCDFGEVLEDVLGNNENEENYITMVLAQELAEKYGDDVTTKEALLLELLEAGNKYLELQKLYGGQGVDFWEDEE